jgi:hypothetical protein
VTTVVDMSHMAHSFELHEQNVRHVRERPARRYSTIISDFGEEYGVLPSLLKPIEWFIADYDRLLHRFPPDDRMAVWIAIGAAWTISSTA